MRNRTTRQIGVVLFRTGFYRYTGPQIFKPWRLKTAESGAVIYIPFKDPEIARE